MTEQPRTTFESPKGMRWLLRIVLWALLFVTATMLHLRWDALPHWKLYLYVGLLFVYLVAENRSHRQSSHVGERSHEELRYLLSLCWWALMLGALLEFALWPKPSLAVTLLGVVLAALGMALRIWSVRTLGRYFSGHIEAWNDQPVVDTGPYRLIRHPGYAGNLLQMIGMPLVVNAYVSLLLSALLIGLFVRRLLWEEEFLTRELPGYQDYRQRTSRLLPGIW